MADDDPTLPVPEASGRFLAGMLPGASAATACGLTLPEDLSENDWTEIGRALGRVQQATQWWIGDWWAFGVEQRYGARRALVESEEWGGPDFQTCMNAASVCRAFAETSRRREVLSFKHHAEVMALSKKQADRLLSWCEAAIAETGKPRSTRELREEMRQRFKPRAARSARVGGGNDTRTEPTVVPFSVEPNIDVTTLDAGAALDLIDEALKEFAKRLFFQHSALKRTMANAQAALGVVREALEPGRL
jgi:hypothetical protein